MRVDPALFAAGHPVLRMLAGAGHRAFVVGGPVRNALLGVAVSDVDIATDARPERVMALAEAAGLRAVPTGLEHGTVTVVTGGAGVEVTTFRRDVETDGRRAVVAFSDRMEEDAARRDFTMNALYADAEGQVFDPLGGLPDLQARRVRFIGEAADRLREDYLRALRFFRFHAWYGDPDGGIDAEGLAACAAHAEGVEGLSRERVGREMLKLLSAPDPAPAVAAMAASGILSRVLPGAVPDLLPVLVHLETGRAAPDGLRRLAALGGTEVAERLRLSKAETRTLDDLRRDLTPGEAGYRLGATRGRDHVLLRAAALGEADPDPALAQAARGAAAVFPLKAADMAGLEGPALGAALKAAEARWIASGFTLDKAALLHPRD